MMKKMTKRLVLGVTAVCLAFSAAPFVPQLAQEPVNVEASEIQPRADVVYWVYRTLSDGTIQKRRWNETRGYWVDPHWITVKV